MRVYYELDLNRFEAWSGAVDTLDKIKEYGAINDLDYFLEEIFPEGMDETELNDFLWFESDYIFECLGILEEED